MKFIQRQNTLSLSASLLFKELQRYVRAKETARKKNSIWNNTFCFLAVILNFCLIKRLKNSMCLSSGKTTANICQPTLAKLAFSGWVLWNTYNWCHRVLWAIFFNLSSMQVTHSLRIKLASKFWLWGSPYWSKWNLLFNLQRNWCQAQCGVWKVW